MYSTCTIKKNKIVKKSLINQRKRKQEKIEKFINENFESPTKCERRVRSSEQHKVSFVLLNRVFVITILTAARTKTQ